MLSDVRSRSGQLCSLCPFADLSVHATARHTRVCLRVAVLLNSAKGASVRSAAAPIVTALATLVVFGPVTRDTARDRASSSSLPLVGVLLPRHPSSIRGAILRRRDTDFLVSLASRRVCREPQSAVSLSSSSSALPPLTRSRLLIWLPSHFLSQLHSRDYHLASCALFSHIFSE